MIGDYQPRLTFLCHPFLLFLFFMVRDGIMLAVKWKDNAEKDNDARLKAHEATGAKAQLLIVVSG